MITVNKRLQNKDGWYQQQVSFKVREAFEEQLKRHKITHQDNDPKGIISEDR